MARLRIIVVAQETDGDVYALATCKFYQPGTATASGSSTSGTPFAGSLYAAISGGSPISTTQTLASNGTLVVWTDSKSRVDVGIEPAGGGTAFVRQYEAAELDPADVMTSVSGEQSVMQTGTLAAPGIAQTGNLDTGFNVDSGGDPAVVKDGVGILETLSTSTYLRSPDGTEAATLSDAGVFSAPGLLRGFGVYNVADHGLTQGNSSSLAAANTAALQTLWATVAAANGGIIYFPSGTWALSAGTTLNHNLGYTVAIDIIGTGHSLLKFWDTTGPFINIGTNASSLLERCGIQGVYVYHENAATSGATFRLGSVSRYTIEQVRLMGNAFIGVQAILKASFHLLNSTVIVNAQANAVCVDLAQTTAGGGGVALTGCDLSGNPGTSRGLRFQNSVLYDTVTLTQTSLKDHYIGISSGLAAGDLANLTMIGGHIDVCDYDVFLSPLSGADYYGWIFDGVWMAATVRNVSIDDSNGGGVQNLSILNGYMTDSTQGAVSVSGATSLFKLQGNTIATDTNDASYPTVGFYTSAAPATPSRVSIQNNDIAAGPLCPAVIQAPVGVTPLVIAGNQLSGGADADGIDVGATSAARVVGSNSYTP